MMQNKFFSLLSAVFSALSSLYQGIFGSRKVRYTEKICKPFVRVKQRKWTSVRKVEMLVISWVHNIVSAL